MEVLTGRRHFFTAAAVGVAVVALLDSSGFIASAGETRTADAHRSRDMHH